jgi:hypothetical protein
MAAQALRRLPLRVRIGHATATLVDVRVDSIFAAAEAASRRERYAQYGCVP